MRKIRIVGIGILLITLLIWGVNMLFVSFPDWAVRVNHIVMLIALVVITFSNIRIRKENRKEDA